MFRAVSGVWQSLAAGGKSFLRLVREGGSFRVADRMLALLRLAVFIGVAAWTVVGPIEPAVRRHCGLLLILFLGYGILILWLVHRRPDDAPAIYLCALFLDLAFLYFLFRETGGIHSPFLPVAFMLAALTAFHYGPVVGVLAAWASLALAVCSDTTTFGERHWGELPLLVGFATLTAGYLGWLAQREMEERRDIQRLHNEIQARAADLEAAYERCREVQDHLVHSERLATIGRMSAEMAHQVRNPLSAISLNLELIEDEVARGADLSGGEAARLIAAIQREIDNLAEVTENYLGFANLPPAHRQEVDLNELVRDILIFAHPQIEDRAVTVSQRLHEPLPPISVDRRQLKFAVINVLNNALDAMPPGGRLRVRTQGNGNNVELSIADTGAGIPAEDMAKIYDPFYTTKQSGTGLGLSLVRRIVEGHGGRIDCRSIRRVGTTFTINLPTNGSHLGGQTDGGGCGCKA